MNEIISLLDNISMKDDSFESSYFYNGKKVPRVTKIIQRCIHNDGLMYWANSLGFRHQSYQKTLNNAATIGTQCHNNIDAFMDNNNHEIPVNIMHEAKNAYNSFRRWYDDVSKYCNINVIFHEKSLVCKYFGGTLDGLYDIGGKIYIIDYKTSNHVTYNYCLQIAAYIYMLQTEMNINPDGCVILQLSKNDISYNEYSLDFSNHLDKQYIDDCMQTFLSMVYYYYNLCNIETDFNIIGWGN